MTTSPIFNLFLKIYAKKITHAAYLGILGREPDEAGLFSYGREIALTGNLSAILSELTTSKEAWERNLCQHPEELVRHAFSGLLSREPEDEALSGYSAQLAASEDLPALLNALGQSQEHWENLICKKSEGLVRSVFRGLLQREPDPEELTSHAAQLAVTKDLEAFISTLGKSDEFWKRLLNSRSYELANGIFCGLLDREPESEDIKNYFVTISSAGQAAQFIRNLLHTEEFWMATLKKHGPQLVTALYQGLLGREPDQDGLLAYQNVITHTGDFTSVIDQICKSQEFQSFHFKNTMSATLIDKSDLMKKVEYIHDLYPRYLGRQVSSIELATHIERDDKIHLLLKKFLRLRPKKVGGQPRILIFGAYGNGNIGDAYQAIAIRSHLKSIWGLKDESIFSCSLLNSAEYSFPSAQKLLANSIYDLQLLNTFDLLIVGGGGLLAHPHDPLTDSAWVSQVRVPIILLGIGAGKGTINNHQALLNNALFVTGRDLESLEALRQIRKDAVLVRDPILSMPDFQPLLEFDTPPVHINLKCDVLWILKYPSNGDDIQKLKMIAERISADSERLHRIVAIEPMLDRALDIYFPKREIIYVKTLSELTELIISAKLVFSMRYHGVIFSLLLNRPVYGFSQRKIHSLFLELDSAENYLETIDELNRAIDNRCMHAEKNLCDMKMLSDQFTKALSAINDEAALVSVDAKYIDEAQ